MSRCRRPTRTERLPSRFPTIGSCALERCCRLSGNPGCRVRSSNEKHGRSCEERDTVRVLRLVFDRLYVLRNQIVHGGATWNSQVNRDQVRDGAAILAFLMPVFVDVMMDHPHEDWGRSFYPVVE